MSVAIRYSFANAKQLHMDIYKEMVLTLASARPSESMLSVCTQALSVADAAISQLDREGRIFKEDARTTHSERS